MRMYGQGPQPQNPAYAGGKREEVPYGYSPAPPPQYAYPQQPQSAPGTYPSAYPGPQGSYVYTSTAPVYGVPPGGSTIPAEYVEDPQRPSNFGASFNDVNIRRAFVRKTYAILLCQLLVTLGFICLFVFCDPVKQFVRQNSWFYYLSYAVFLITYISLVCCPGVRRRYPGNLILLCVFTLAMSYMTATISSYHDTKIVIMSIGICAFCCLTVSIGSAFCNFDVTRWGWLLGIAAIILMLLSIVSLMFAFIPSLHTPWYHGIFSGLIALVFMGFLAYDTQMILGGRQYELSPEEHIYGALQLYLDVVYIFLGILGISGAASNN